MLALPTSRLTTSGRDGSPPGAIQYGRPGIRSVSPNAARTAMVSSLITERTATRAWPSRPPVTGTDNAPRSWRRSRCTFLQSSWTTLLTVLASGTPTFCPDGVCAGHRRMMKDLHHARILHQSYEPLRAPEPHMSAHHDSVDTLSEQLACTKVLFSSVQAQVSMSHATRRTPHRPTQRSSGRSRYNAVTVVSPLISELPLHPHLRAAAQQAPDDAQVNLPRPAH